MLFRLGLRAYLRYVLFLIGEFRVALGVFAATVFIGGVILHHFYHHEYVSLPKAFYSVFLMVFLESGLDFPDEWYLQPLFFIVPIIGLGAVADSVVRLAYLIFTRKRNLPEWQRMVASLYRNHIVVVGLGRVGFRVVTELVEMKEPVVVIDSGVGSSFLDQVLDLRVPVIQGNARLEKVLIDAGVAHARAVILATSDDLTNIDAGLTARDLNPKANIVLRLFDDSLARKISGAFAMPAISTASVSAPAFIAAATDRKVYQTFELSGKKVHMTDIVIHPEGKLIGKNVGTIQADTIVNIVMHQGAEGVNVNPGHSIVLAAGDTILVIAPLDRLIALEGENHPSGKAPREALVPSIARSSTPFPDLIG